MDRELFSKMVKELLLRDGLVEFPGLGTLQMVSCPASFSDRGFTLNPPYKKLVFYSEEGRTSGAFANERPSGLSALYAAANGIPEQRALIAIGEIIEGLRSAVTPLQDYELPDLGRFRRLRDGSLFFVQSQYVDVCPAYDCLQPVSLKSLETVEKASAAQPAAPTVAPAAQETSAKTQAQVFVHTGRKRRRCKRIAVWSVCIAVISVGIFFASLAVLGRTNPELVDPLLYSEEQLDVIYSRF